MSAEAKTEIPSETIPTGLSIITISYLSLSSDKIFLYSVLKINSDGFGGTAL